VGILATENEDVRSLRELLIIGTKGIAAYADHAAILGYEKDEVYAFIMEALASTTRDHSVDEMVALVLKAGETAVATMALTRQTLPLTVIPKSRRSILVWAATLAS